MKPVVHYSALRFCKVGKPAVVFPVDHTSPLVSNSQICYTSTVQSYDEVTGIFETLNTVYEPTHETQKAAS